MDLENTRKKQLSSDMRELICKKYDEGESKKNISDVLKINYKTVASVILKYVTTGNTQAKKKRVSKIKKISNEAQGLIINANEKDVSISLEKLKSKLNQIYGIDVCTSKVNNIIFNLNYSFK
ncbi:hypothetical protein GVAV_002772 [Gurleya vavrai]